VLWREWENAALLQSEWALREQIGMNAKRFGFNLLSYEQSMMD